MIAALYVAAGGSYYGLPGVDPWDQARDARRYAGPFPVVAHPPCQRWGQLWAGQPLHIKRTGERKRKGDDDGCFAAALAAAREWGGVIEHPWRSHAWPHFGLRVPPRAGGWIEADDQGGWTCCVEQGRYGHYARKPTLLLAYRTDRPELEWGVGERRLDPTVVARMGLERAKRLGEVGGRGGGRDSAPRIGTPQPFRDLLLRLAASVYEIDSLTGRKPSGNLLLALNQETFMKDLTLTMTFSDLTSLAKAVVALRDAGANPVVGGGAAVPTPAGTASVAASAPAPVPHAAPAAPPVPTPTPPPPPPPAEGALTFQDVMNKVKTAIPTLGAERMGAVYKQFGIGSPLQLKDRPDLWAGFIHACDNG